MDDQRSDTGKRGHGNSSSQRTVLKSIDDFRAAFHAVGDAVFILDAQDGTIRDANRKMSEMYGFGLDEVVGMKWGDICGDSSLENAEGADCRIMNAAETGSGLFEWPVQRKTGERFWVEANVRVAATESGNFIVMTTRDITDRKRIERELTAATDYLNTVFHNIHDAVFIHDVNGKVIDVNDKMLEMYRFTREEAIGLHIIPDYTTPDNRPDFPAIWKKVLAGEGGMFECRGRRPKDGHEFDVEVILTKLPLPGADRILATVRDVTARKKAERELTATRDYLNTVFNNIHDAVFIHDINGKVIDVNNKMLEMYRFTREEAIGLSIIPDYTVPGDPVDHREKWRKAMAGESQFFESTGRRPKDGYEFMVDVFLTRLSLPEGDFLIATVRDITQRKIVERELRATKEYLDTVFNNIHDAVFVHDVDGKVIDVNDKMLEMYQFTKEEAVGLSIMQDYTVPEGRPDLPAIWRRVVAGEDGFIECRGRRPKDGYQFDVEVFMTKLSLPDGDYVLASVREITQRRIVEKLLMTEKQKFQTLSERSPVGMAVIDQNDQLRFKYMNPKFKELFACNTRDVPAVSDWLARIYPEPIPRRRASPKWIDILNTVKPGVDTTFIRKLLGKDGSARYVKFVPVPLQTGEVLMACWDITKNKEAEQRIKERNLVLGVLNEIMASATGSLHLSRILQALQRVFTERLKSGVGGIFFRNEVDGKINEGICWGVPVKSMKDLAAFALKCYGEGKVIYDNEITLVRRRLTGCDPDLPDAFKEYRWHSCLCISLPTESGTEGLIFFADKKADAFNDYQTAFYKALGQQVSVAAQNASLFEQVRQSHEEMKNLSLRLVRVQEDELRHVARELHDEIGQLLTGLGLALEMASQSTGDGAPSLAEAKSLTDTLTGLVRELSRRLRPTMLDDLGLVPTLPWLFKRFATHSNLQVSFEHMRVENRRFSHEAETAIYRITQEALTNVARHGKVNWAAVRLWSTDKTLALQIEDHGIGFDVHSALKEGNSNGLNGMRERVLLLGGSFTLDSNPGAGTRLTAEIPIDSEGVIR